MVAILFFYFFYWHPATVYCKREPRVVVAPQEVAVLVACGRWKKVRSTFEPSPHTTWTTQPMTMTRPTNQPEQFLVFSVLLASDWSLLSHR